MLRRPTVDRRCCTLSGRRRRARRSGQGQLETDLQNARTAGNEARQKSAELGRAVDRVKEELEVRDGMVVHLEQRIAELVVAPQARSYRLGRQTVLERAPGTTASDSVDVYLYSSSQTITPTRCSDVMNYKNPMLCRLVDRLSLASCGGLLLPNVNPAHAPSKDANASPGSRDKIENLVNTIGIRQQHGG